jgi:hypothetical protein
MSHRGHDMPILDQMETVPLWYPPPTVDYNT